MSDNEECPIWGTEARIQQPVINNLTRKDVEVSPRAGGPYCIEDMAIDLLNRSDMTKKIKAKLTTWLIDQRKEGPGWPTIDTSIIEQVRQRQPLPVHERAYRLLKYLEKKSPEIGSTVKCEFHLNNNPVRQEMMAWSESISPKELLYLLDYLTERTFITVKKLGFSFDDSPGSFQELPENIDSVILMEGYAHLAELATKHVNSSQGFVAMWFDDSMTEAYENGIRLGIGDAGYSPRRIDEKHHINKIDDEIIAEIRRSRFVVADFTHGDTGHRGGVYYEAGFAHGLGIPVFFTCRKDVLDKIHFDTRQYNHIQWETHAELRKALADKISAVMGDGPNKTPAVE